MASVRPATCMQGIGVSWRAASDPPATGATAASISGRASQSAYVKPAPLEWPVA